MLIMKFFGFERFGQMGHVGLTFLLCFLQRVIRMGILEGQGVYQVKGDEGREDAKESRVGVKGGLVT